MHRHARTRSSCLLLVTLGALTTLAQADPSPSSLTRPAPPTPQAACARGQVGGRPFTAASVLAWKDPDRCWLSFKEHLPMTGGRFDPRARRGVESAFEVLLDASRLKPGRWQLRDSQAPPRDCPITGCRLVEVTGSAPRGAKPGVTVRCLSAGWSIDLAIERCSVTQATNPITDRVEPGRVAVEVRGRLELVFEPQRSWLAGPFAAVPVLRAHESMH